MTFDRKSDIKYRNPNVLDYIIIHASDMSRHFYVFIDEIQLSYEMKNDDVDEII